MQNIEMEYKWDANVPHAFARARRALTKLVVVRTEAQLHITDTYLDHSDGSFTKQRIAFRVRNTAGQWEATFKTRTEVKHGKAVRQEETLPLPGVKDLTQALAFLQHKKTWKGLRVSNLQTKFSLQNKRHTYKFNFENSHLEMALDDVTIWVCGRQLKMKEIELELKYGSVKSFEKFARTFASQTQFKAMEMSKVKTAEALLDLWK